MKIGIITFQYANNFGALYQSYALKKFLESLGHKVFILNFYPDIKKQKKKYSIYNLPYPSHFIRRFFRITSRNHQLKFYSGFNEFRAKHLNLSSEKIHLSDLEKTFPDANIYICGSDQIWNTDFASFSKAYLLSFLPQNVKRIAYAASLGREEIDRKYQNLFHDELSKFSSIFVREKNGCEIVNKLLNCKIEHVVDPTLLLNNYNEIIDITLVPNTPYLLVYRLSQNYELTKWMDKTIKIIAKFLKLPVYSVSPNSIYVHTEIGKQLIPTPEQLLGLIKNANLFITNSFHGMVFTIILKTPFFILPRDMFVNKQNVRMVEMLNDLNLYSQYIVYSKENIEPKALNFEFNWNVVNSKLKNMKEKSIILLTNAIEENLIHS